MTYGDYLDWWYTENYPPNARTTTESGGSVARTRMRR